MGLLSSLFGGNKPSEEQQAKQDKKNFEILNTTAYAHATCISCLMPSSVSNRLWH